MQNEPTVNYSTNAAKPQGAQYPTPLETARFFLEHGIRSVPVPYGEKDPHDKGWPDKLYGADDLERVFGRRTNIGALLGVKSGNLVDDDLDTLEAVRAARFFLPETGMVWGRSRKPRSHWLYRLVSSDGVRSLRYKDPTPKAELERRGLKAMLVEIRFNGNQTIAPGSINKANDVIDPVRWAVAEPAEPADIDYETLVFLTERLAAVALIARYWRDGARDDTALPLAGLLWHGGMPLDDALLIMEAVCVAAQDEQREARLACVRDTYRKGEAREHVTGGPTLAAEAFSEVIVRKLRAWLHLTAKKDRGMLGPDFYPLESDGDADRFAARWGDEVRYCKEDGCWYLWTGKRWEVDRTGYVMEMAKTVMREFRTLVGVKSGEANVYGVGSVASYDVCANYAVKLGSEKKLNAMLALARTKKELAVTPEQFDADPLMFNAQDCTLDLNTTTGEVTSHLHNSDDLITRIANANYRPDATHHLVEQAFARFHPEPDHRAFIEEMAGYCLTGLPKRHGLQLIGPHDSGKSTILAMFKNPWGDYGKSLKDTNLAKNPHRGGDVARPDLLRVVDARLVTITEVDPDTKFDVALFKAILSGTDTVGLRTLYDKGGGKDEIFHCSIWMSGNKEYGLPADEGEAYSRVEVLDCNHAVLESERKGAEEVATTDPAVVGDAVLALAVRGFQRLYGEHHGVLQSPASAITAKQELRESRDQWSAIIEQAFIITNDPNDAVKKSEAWAVARHLVSMSGETIHKPRALQKSFEEALEWRVGKFTKSSGRWNGADYWPGVRWVEGIAHDLRSFDIRISQPDWSAE